MKTFLDQPKAEMKLAIAGVLVLAALSPSAFSAAPVDGPEYVLENASIRLGLKDNRIVSLLDKVRLIEHVSPQATSAKGMFSIQLLKGIQPVGELDARDMTARVTRRDANQIDLEFTHPQAVVRARIVLAKTPGEIECSLSVTPKSGLLSVARADFPVIETPSADTGGGKRCLLPYREGRLTPLNLPLSDEPKLSFFTYPKHLFAQMIACLGTNGGFLLWTDDQKGHIKEFGRDNDHDDSTFAIKHFFPYEPGRPCDVSYRSRITFTGPEWQDAADVYREWASTQPWSAVKLRDRQDIPEILKAPPVCVSGQIDKEDLEALPGKLKAWRDQYQAPVIYRPLGWEKHGNWMGIDYFPTSIGDARFVATAQRLRDDGIVIAGFISGFAWKTSLGKGEGGDANREETARLLEKHFRDNNGNSLCEQDREGKVRKPARVCRGTDFGRIFLQSTAARLFDLGVTVIHDDVDYGTFQFISEGCFNKTHGHPVPCGTWEIDITRKAFQDISEEARRRGVKDFFVTKEYYTELLNQDIHASQARFFKAASEPHHIPLAQYLYHEYVFSIFGWGCDNRPLSKQTAMLLVCGQIPCFPSWGKAMERPPKNRLVSDYYDAMRTHAKDFLLFGRMRRPLAVTNPNDPPVIQSAWDDERGTVGVFAVNTQPKGVVIEVPAPGPGTWRGTFYVGDSQQQVQTVAVGKTLEWRLPSGRLASIVLTPSK
jgi:hypothetical protein